MMKLDNVGIQLDHCYVVDYGAKTSKRKRVDSFFSKFFDVHKSDLTEIGNTEFQFARWGLYYSSGGPDNGYCNSYEAELKNLTHWTLWDWGDFEKRLNRLETGLLTLCVSEICAVEDTVVHRTFV